MERDNDGDIWSAWSDEIGLLARQGQWLPGPTAALEVLGQTGSERAHQAYIAWLLDPAGSHGLGTRLLVNMLGHLFAGEVAPPGLAVTQVRSEDVRSQSRADIVVRMTDRTLVIELKVHSGEGDEQTRRLADDHSGSPDPLFVFLTLNGDRPLDGRFQPMRLGQLAICLRAALEDAPEPHSWNEQRGRATASDYLSALERKCGMAPVNEHAALFWLRHGREMGEAQEEARRLLALLPGEVETALTGLAEELAVGLQVTRVEYVAPGRRADYPELPFCYTVGTGVAPPQNRCSLLGLGSEPRTLIPFDPNKMPFFGVWARDLQARAALGDGAWHNWAWWNSVDLTPPENGENLLRWYRDAAVQAVHNTWNEYGPRIDELAENAFTADEQRVADHLDSAETQAIEGEEIKAFHDNDEAYEQWTAQHGGFVLTTPRMGQHMLHVAQCSHLGKETPDLSLTRRPRWWCQRQEPLVAWTEAATGTAPLRCQSCM